MPRYKLTVEYDGSEFVGWQWQANGYSVQQALEEAVAAFSGEAVRVHGAGRTDAGVHAVAQACHLDLAGAPAPDTLRDALNAYLRPRRVSVLAAETVADDFDARRSATARIYRYRIVNRRAPLALDVKRAWQISRELDADAMARAAKRLLGRHDFSSFRASACQAPSPIKTLDAFEVIRRAEEIHLTARSESFLHHQMRAMVGSLVWVGERRWPEAHIDDVLAARDRRRAGPNAPPWGLYLEAVLY
ncbi:MAG: tRNA pseudouridine(38-40) synthase TruA [Alphaproteobacteria bacterium]